MNIKDCKPGDRVVIGQVSPEWVIGLTGVVIDVGYNDLKVVLDKGQWDKVDKSRLADPEHSKLVYERWSNPDSLGVWVDEVFPIEDPVFDLQKQVDSLIAERKELVAAHERVLGAMRQQFQDDKEKIGEQIVNYARDYQWDGADDLLRELGLETTKDVTVRVELSFTVSRNVLDDDDAFNEKVKQEIT